MQHVKYLFLLLLTALIWGFAFVAQKAGMEHIGPFAFNGIRFALGALSVLPLFLFQKKLFGTSVKRSNPKTTLFAGVLMGFLLFVAAGFQQVGMVRATAGNAGFITSLYIIIVPFLGVFLKHKIAPQVWMGALLSVAGLYLLSVNRSFQMAPGDGLVLVSAFFWSLHILVTGHYASKTNVLLFSLIQFTASSLLNLLTAWALETATVNMVEEALIPLLYGGIMSIGVAYTLQIVGQRKVAPSKAAIVLSLESVFAVLGGWLLLDEPVGLRKAAGGMIMLSGLIISQVNFAFQKQKKIKRTV